LTRIYTRTGDKGTTGRIGGERVSKDSPYIEACGALDELNALIGLVRTQPLPDRVEQVLQRVQDDLFTIGAALATPAGTKPVQPGIRDEDIRALENEIDFFESRLQPLKRFILPGGAASGASLQYVRAVVRRAERRCVALSRLEQIEPLIVVYLNRFSDLCFVMARYANSLQSIPESHPTYGAGKKP
jgi:cob(I)alamin adenosyltransferase